MADSASSQTAPTVNPYATGIAVDEETSDATHSLAARVTGVATGAFATVVFFVLGWAALTAVLPGITIRSIQANSVVLSFVFPAVIAPIFGWIIGRRIGRRAQVRLQRVSEVELRRAAMNVQAADLKTQHIQRRQATASEEYQSDSD